MVEAYNIAHWEDFFMYPVCYRTLLSSQELSVLIVSLTSVSQGLHHSLMLSQGIPLPEENHDACISITIQKGNGLNFGRVSVLIQSTFVRVILCGISFSIWWRYGCTSVLGEINRT